MATEKDLKKEPNNTAENGSNASQNKQSVPYQTGTDYQKLINDAVSAGNYIGAAQYEQQRNAKIQGEGLNYQQSNIYADYLPGGAKYTGEILKNVDPSDQSSIYAAYRSVLSQPSSATDQSAYINQLYDASAAATKAALEAQYAGTEEALAQQQQQAEQAARQNATQIAVAGQEAQKAWNEAQTAYGLSGGAKGQAALSRSNQVQSDITAVQTAKQAALADIEQQRATYRQQYDASLREAAATNDYERAKALYQEAVRLEEALAQQKSQVDELSLGYLTTLDNAASSSGSKSGTSKGGSGDALTYKEIKELQEIAATDPKKAEQWLEWYYANGKAVTESDYAMVMYGLENGGNEDEPAPSGYGAAGIPAGGSTTKKKETK